MISNGGDNGASGKWLRLMAEMEQDAATHELMRVLMPLDDERVQQWPRSDVHLNTEFRIEWERRSRYGIRYTDLMGELSRAEWNARHEQRIRLAKHMGDVVRDKKANRVFRARLAEAKLPKGQNVVSIFHQRQAGEHR